MAEPKAPPWASDRFEWTPEEGLTPCTFGPLALIFEEELAALREMADAWFHMEGFRLDQECQARFSKAVEAVRALRKGAG